ncbi:hypothetical protein [Bacillus niameyensis]|uniref:hypothetical protein n=1 Tax=Bacillus niameyensis TaxID=1522308 RepID=UPI0007857EB5|nr:hypothetical protein [Bacillus niameyensis]
MKSAMVIGARQDLGFEICKELLNEGMIVHARDFSEWQTEQHEERWLFIGRNANLDYSTLNKKDMDRKNIDYLFIPLTDFYVGLREDIHNQIISLLRHYFAVEAIKSTIVIVQPSVMEREWEDLYLKMEEWKVEMNKRNWHIAEYYIGMSEHDQTKVYFKSDEKCEWVLGNSREREGHFIKNILEHLEGIKR